MSDTEEEFFDSEWGYTQFHSSYNTKKPEDDEEAKKKEELEKKLADEAAEKFEASKRRQSRQEYEAALMKAVSVSPKPRMTYYDLSLLHPKEYKKAMEQITHGNGD